MTGDSELDRLIDDTEAQLEAALDAVASGAQVDLTDLVPRVDRLCAHAVERHAVAAAPRLARLIERLDILQRLLREAIAAGASRPGDAAARYRAAAAPPRDPEG